jgi:hypothetical protein
VDRVGDVLQLVGAALVVAAAWAVWAPLGLLAGGMALGAVGVAVKRDGDA